jgi:hypothetical protein
MKGIALGTKIHLLSGNDFSIENLTNVFLRTSLYLYSVDSMGLTVNRSVLRYEGCDETLVVTLDDQSKLKVGKDQVFLLRTGERKCASNLKCGDSLMPLYTTVPNNGRWSGYEVCFDPIRNKEIPTHVNVGSWKYPGRYPAGGYVIHHWNYTALDNSPGNLVLMTFREHSFIHSVLLKQRWKHDTKFRESVSNAARVYLTGLWKSQEFRIRRAKISSERLRQLWEDGEFRETMQDLKRKEMESNWKDPEFIEAHRQGRQNFWYSPEFEASRQRRKERVQVSLSRNWATEDRRIKMEEAKIRNRQKNGYTLEKIQSLILERNIRTLSGIADGLGTDRKMVRCILRDADILEADHSNWVRNYGKNHKVAFVEDGSKSELFSLSGTFAVNGVFCCS